MGADKDIIVAVELGSTAIRAIAGKREPDGTMQILAVAQVKATHSIRNGIVDNIDKTTQAISKVVGQINDKLNVHTTRVYVGLSGQSLHTAENKVEKSFETKVQISNTIIDNLGDINRAVIYPNSEILDVIPQEYRLGSRSNVTEPVGMQSEQIEARFLNVVARKSLKENIEHCIREAGLELADELIISPLALADSLLSPSEKRSGCALVDFGADTTTVSVYTNNLLRHLVVIPLGGNNVTADIATKKMELEEAEQLKLKHGTAYHDETEAPSSHKIQLSFDRSIEEDVLQEIVESRYEEIIINVWEQISAESDKLLSGIVMTGGAAKISKLTEAFSLYTHCNKSVRLAKGLPMNVTTAPGVHLPENECLYTLMAILQKGEQTCIGETPVEEAVQTEIQFDIPEVTEKNEPQEEKPVEKPMDKKPKEKMSTRLKRAWTAISDMFTDPEDEEDEE